MKYEVNLPNGKAIDCDTIAQALRVVADEMEKGGYRESNTIRVSWLKGESVYGKWRPDVVPVPMPGLYWVFEHKLWRQVVL
jgi:hypothetical protein